MRRPGSYPLLGEMRVKDLVARAGWLTKEAYLPRAEIIRVTANRDLQSIPLNLEAALREYRADNLLLQDDDTVVIHNLFEQKYRQNARVSGLVNKPDIYPITAGMRISDLVFRAGGVQKLAYLEKAELTRHKITQGGDFITRVEVNLNQAFAGDPEHNILLEDFDHLLVRRISISTWLILMSNSRGRYCSPASTDPEGGTFELRSTAGWWLHPERLFAGCGLHPPGCESSARKAPARVIT